MRKYVGIEYCLVSFVATGSSSDEQPPFSLSPSYRSGLLLRQCWYLNCYVLTGCLRS